MDLILRGKKSDRKLLVDARQLSLIRMLDVKPRAGQP
jgi:hypothetical protein